MFLKSTLCAFFDILFNNHCYQSHRNDDKKLNRIVHPSIYRGTFSY